MQRSLESKHYHTSIQIIDRKSARFCVRGIATVDGLEMPFTAWRIQALDYSDFESDNFYSRVAVRTKDGILNKYKDKDHYLVLIKNAAKSWWIDNDYWSRPDGN